PTHLQPCGATRSRPASIERRRFPKQKEWSRLPLDGLLVAHSFVAILAGDDCLGSNLFHVISHQADFKRSTGLIAVKVDRQSVGQSTDASDIRFQATIGAFAKIRAGLNARP